MDPYNGLLQSPHNWLVFHPLYSKQPIFFLTTQVGMNMSDMSESPPDFCQNHNWRTLERTMVNCWLGLSDWCASPWFCGFVIYIEYNMFLQVFLDVFRWLPNVEAKT